MSSIAGRWLLLNELVRFPFWLKFLLGSVFCKLEYQVKTFWQKINLTDGPAHDNQPNADSAKKNYSNNGNFEQDLSRKRVRLLVNRNYF